MKPLPVSVRLVVMWIAIYPLVLIGNLSVGPLTSNWPPALATALVMALVIPVAVLGTVPLVTRVAVRLLKSRSRAEAQR